MICRACLSDKPELLISLLDNSNLMEMYKSCTYLQVNTNDNLPKTLCSSCINQCVSWNSFKEMCAFNETLLLGAVNRPSPVQILQPQISADKNKISVKDHIKKYFNNSTELAHETKTIDLKVEFEEVTIKNEFLTLDELFDEIPNTSEIKIDEENASDIWDCDSTNEITNNLKIVEMKNLEKQSTLINQEQMTIECAECGEKFANKLLIKIHMKKHIPPHMKWECSHCNRTYLTEQYLLQHNNRGTCELKCYICRKQFKSVRELRAHRLKHLDNRPYQCKFCNRSFTTELFLTKHTCNRNGTPFPCNKCNKSFMTNRGLRYHNESHMVKSFICDKCGKLFPNKGRLKAHFFNHIAEKPFKCTKCEKSFKENCKLINHMRSHTGERPFTCKICFNTFFSNERLRQHSVIHLDVKPFKCEFCDKRFYRKSVSVLHMRTHTGERKLNCTECEKTFIRKSTLNMHMECHKDEKPFNCTICKKSYGFEINLKNHIKYHLLTNENNLKQKHECPICKKMITRSNKYSHMYTHAERTFKCELCSWTFSNLSRLKQHMLTHTNEKSHKCDYCEKSFKRLCERNEHRKLHTGEAHACNLCNKVYKRNNELVDHMRSHTGEKPFKCEYCEKSFQRATVRNLHRKLHTGEAPTCKLCSKVYERNADLIIHMRSHTGEKPFKCTECNVSFPSQCNLKKHNKRKHEVLVK